MPGRRRRLQKVALWPSKVTDKASKKYFFYVTNVKYKTVFKCLVKALKYSTLDLNPELCNYPLKKNKWPGKGSDNHL